MNTSHQHVCDMCYLSKWRKTTWKSSCHTVTFMDSLSPPPSLSLSTPNIPHMRRSNKLPNEQQQLAAILRWGGTRCINGAKVSKHGFLVLNTDKSDAGRILRRLPEPWLTAGVCNGELFDVIWRFKCAESRSLSPRRRTRWTQRQQRRRCRIWPRCRPPKRWVLRLMATTEGMTLCESKPVVKYISGTVTCVCYFIIWMLVLTLRYFARC